MGFDIGNVHIDGGLILGPMAGVCDMPYRMICRECGADMVYSEMVSAKGILYNNKNTYDLLRFDEREHPCALQLFGSDPDIMAEMAAKTEGLPFDVLDINMGCPVPKIVNNHEGSALMQDPGLVGKIVGKISRAIKKPVTVKIRKSLKSTENTAVEVALAAQENGAAAVAVHPRSREEYYSGHSHWEVIAEVKKALKIPVIGSGDVKCGADAKRMKEETGCDGIMIARAARGNPWIFSDIKYYLETGREPEKRSQEEIVRMILKHAGMLCDFKGEYIAIREMRKHIAWYTAGLKNSAKLRADACGIETMEELKRLVNMIEQVR